MTDLTIFVATCNRLDTLTRTLDSYRNQTVPYEVVIVDNGSDHPDCIEHLDRVEHRTDVSRVHRAQKITTLDNLAANVTSAMAERHSEPQVPRWFAVTDPDICFDGSHPDTFASYIKLAEGTHRAVGPHLRIDKHLSHGYPLRSKVIVYESRVYYKTDQFWLDDIPFTPCQIDTTFHLFPAIPHFPRLRMHTARVGPPFDAMHLDWYSDIFNPTEENRIYIPHTGWSWGGSWFSGFWQAFQRDPLEAYAGALQEVTDDAHGHGGNAWCLLSWCFQHGIYPADVTEDPIEQSKKMLLAGIPASYWPNRKDWMDMIYDDDFTSLGWQA